MLDWEKIRRDLLEVLELTLFILAVIVTVWAVVRFT